MKYSKLKLIDINIDSTEAVCDSGSGASGDGCINGPSVGAACGNGSNPGIGISCWDGSSAGWCGYGNAPNTGTSSRCETGTGVVNP